MRPIKQSGKEIITPQEHLKIKPEPISKTVSGLTSHCKIWSKIGTDFLKSPKSKSMLEFPAHIYWVITVDYKVWLGQVK